MANTLTNLIPDIYAALDVVSRELVGLIPAVSRDSSLARAALDETIRSPVAPAATAANVTPGQLPADNGDQTITNKTITISKSRYCPIRWSGEEQKGINNGPGYANVRRDQIAQAMRTLTNEIESDLAGLYIGASRAIGPAGTTLFDAANYKDVANVRKILVDNGAPLDDMHLILSTTAGAALRGNAQYAGANTAGREDIIRQGVLLDVHGMAIRESGQVKTAAKGTASGATTNAAGYAVGATTITLASAGTGTFVAGDIITFLGDTNRYVLVSGDADVSGGGTIVLAEPGLKVAIATATTAITVVADTEMNMAFSRNAIHLVTRAPARPEEGDLAIDSMIVQDPKSGLAFEISKYAEYRRVKYEVAMAWGYAVIKPQHLALLTD